MPKAPAPAEDEKTEPRPCSKCGKPVDNTGTPYWCNACRAKWRKDYDELVEERTESRGYNAGISAMRDYLAGRFAALGGGSFTGTEVALLIRQSLGPSAVKPKQGTV